MDDIFDRFGNFLKNTFGETDSKKSSSPHRDPDYDEAMAELDDYLNEGRKSSGSSKSSQESSSGARTHSQESSKSYEDWFKEASRGSSSSRRPEAKTIPPQILKDYATLGVPPGSTIEIIKAAYKKLLKAYHPDKHSGNAEAVRHATEFTTTFNTAYARLEEYLLTGKIDS